MFPFGIIRDVYGGHISCISKYIISNVLFLTYGGLPDRVYSFFQFLIGVDRFDLKATVPYPRGAARDLQSTIGW